MALFPKKVLEPPHSRSCTGHLGARASLQTQDREENTHLAVAWHSGSHSQPQSQPLSTQGCSGLPQEGCSFRSLNTKGHSVIWGRQIPALHPSIWAITQGCLSKGPARAPEEGVFLASPSQPLQGPAQVLPPEDLRLCSLQTLGSVLLPSLSFSMKFPEDTVPKGMEPPEKRSKSALQILTGKKIKTALFILTFLISKAKDKRPPLPRQTPLRTAVEAMQGPNQTAEPHHG